MTSASHDTHVVITLDTEADNVWKGDVEVTTENLNYLDRFQALCNRYGLKPTYLCTTEIAEAPQFERLAAYQADGVAEVGAHLHPWTTPPLRDDPKQPPRKYFPSELPDEEFRAKMENLTDAIESRTSVRPTSYRAGRFGFKSSHVGILLDMGYTVDCSVTPLATWQYQRGAEEPGPDFRRAPAHPYFLDPHDVCRAGDSALLEVPVTIVCANDGRLKMLRKLIKREDTRVFRGPCKLLGVKVEWFRPFPYMTVERLKAVYRLAVERRLGVADLMFHSSELMPGGSPYYPTAESIEELYMRLDALFAFVTENGGKGTTLSDLTASVTSRMPRSTSAG